MHVTCIDSKLSLFKRRNLFTRVNVADVELRLDAGGRPVKFSSKLSDVDVMNSTQLTLIAGLHHRIPSKASPARYLPSLLHLLQPGTAKCLIIPP